MALSRHSINRLPANVLDKILGILPIEEAARTAVLSTTWRHAWSRLTQLNFDKRFFGHIERKYPKIDDNIWADASSYVINKVLLQHNGPVSKFLLDFLGEIWSSDLDEWFRSVTKKGVEEIHLAVNSNQYELPNCIFSCSTLKKLHLSRVSFDSAHTRSVFPNVTSICFEGVCFNPENPLADDRPIALPVLESLSFSQCQIMCEFNFTAPKLSSLSIKSCEKVDFLPVNLDLKSIRTLALDFCFLEDFIEGVARMGGLQPSPLINVEYLTVLDTFIGNRYGTNSAFIQLLQICPKLCILDICLSFDECLVGRDIGRKFWEELQSLAQKHKMLHTLKLSSFRGLRYEMLFIKALLDCFSALEKVIIIRHKDAEQELLDFPRASRNANIEFF